jgi:hypothetical protein
VRGDLGGSVTTTIAGLLVVSVVWLALSRRAGELLPRARVSEVDGPGMWRPERLVYGGSVRREL